MLSMLNLRCCRSPNTHMCNSPGKTEECKRILMRDDVLLNELDYCYTHQRQCRRLPVVEGQGHLSVLVAGSPCPDFSAYGKRSRDLGKTGHLFVILKLGYCCKFWASLGSRFSFAE